MIEIKKLSFKYSSSQKLSLDNISLNIEDGEFVLITGPSGCGKSTLCRCLNGLIPSFYGGQISGEATVQNMDAIRTSTSDMAKKVGMVFQDPENQLVSSNVEREIAFGLENLGFPKDVMVKRIEEVLDTVGIDHLRHRDISSLSGGEKQKIAIASVLALHPEIIVLDEPTSELDPKGAEEVIQLVKRLNEELGVTIILIEHRLDRVIQSADRLIVMDNSKIIFDNSPQEWILFNNGGNTNIAIPPVALLYSKLKEKDSNLAVPLTIKEGRKNFANVLKKQNWKNVSSISSPSNSNKDELLVSIRSLWYKYPEGEAVLKDVNLDLYKGEFIALIGRNAAGKTTLAKMLNGLLKPSKGKVMIKGLDTKKTSVESLSKVIGYVFQDPNLHLFADTVEEEITFMMNNLGFSKEIIENRLNAILKNFNLEYCQYDYPHSLSTGEKQRVALASVMSARPEILILDEPTRGLDYKLKKNLMNYLTDYRKTGGTVLLISHDIELIAEFGERVVLMSEGKIIADGDKHKILSNSLHFSPQINRLIQPFTKYGYSSEILTVNEIMQGFK